MPRIMAIDYGLSRIGIALTDPLQIISSGFVTLTNDSDSYKNIIDIIKTKDVETLVIGIPFDQESKIGDSARKVLVFAERLLSEMEKIKLKISVYEQDERYSTRTAHESMSLTKIKNKNRKKIVDQIAAANILKEFMESNKKTLLDIKKY